MVGGGVKGSFLGLPPSKALWCKEHALRRSVSRSKASDPLYGTMGHFRR